MRIRVKTPNGEYVGTRVIKFLKRLPENTGIVIIKGRERLVKKVHTASGSVYAEVVIGSWKAPKSRRKR